MTRTSRYSSSQRVKEKICDKSDPLLYGLNLNHLAYILCMAGADQYQHSGSKMVNVGICGRVPIIIAFNENLPGTKLHVYWYHGY